MGVLETIRRTFGTSTAEERPKSHWNAGRSNRAFGSPVGNAGPNESNTPYLFLLRSRVRDKVRNSPIASRAIDVIVSEMIGAGIVPLPQADGSWKRELSGMWDAWAEAADYDGRTDLYGLQALAVRAWQESGEVFVRMVVVPYDGGEVVPLRLQVLEADMVPLASGTAPNGNDIVNGIEFKDGKRVAYWILKKHPGDYPLSSGYIGSYVAGKFDTEKMIRVPAEEMLHVYEQSRPGQLRGVPKLATVLQTIAQLSDFDEATLERQKLAASMTTFISRPAPLDPGIDPVTGEQIDPSLVQESTINPGSAYTLLPGEAIENPDLPELGNSYDSFVKHNERQIASGVGIPYEILTGDFSAANDRTARVALGVFRRDLQQLQWSVVIHQFCRPVWAKMLQVAVLNGMTIIKLAGVKVSWTPQAWPYINPVQDIEAQAAAIDAGLTSRTATILERGDDPEQVDSERAADQQREAALKITSQATVPATV